MQPEETLDPEDWSDLRALGHRMVDDMMQYLETLRDRPAWQPVPADVRAFFGSPPPVEGEGAAQAYADFQRYVLPYPVGNIHPRFWGWVQGTGTPTGMLAEMLAAGMNPNSWGAEQSATYVETQVLGWCKEMLGYPAEAAGLLCSGGSMANLIGLTVARNEMAGFDVRKEGVQAAPRPLVLYASEETHSSVQKAAEVLGLGHAALRRIAVGADYRIDLDALAAAVAADRAAGRQPFCVVGNAGTVNTGAVDDLAALADVCAAEDLWFHVDGAFGALAALDPDLRPLLRGMERADSLAFDLHKWMYMPYEAGCALVRRPEAQRAAFALAPSYLAAMDQGVAAGTTWFNDLGLQLSRGFRALKVWMSLKEHGVEKYGRLIRQNVAQARYLAARVDAHDDLVLLAPVPLNIVCFRYAPAGVPEARLNDLNRALLGRLQEEGIAVPSHTLLAGRFALRVAITNHRSRREDFDALIAAVRRIGGSLKG